MAAKTAEAGTPAPGPAAPGGVDRAAIACAAVLVAAVAAVYSGTFSVPPLLDDPASIAGNATIRRLGTAFWPPGGTSVSGRPVLNLSLAVNYAVSGESVWSYHALNLVVHALAGLALFGIVRRTLAPRLGTKATAVAFCAALLWSLHPLLTESVTYIIQRAESLMGLFYLLTLYCFIRGAQADAPGRRAWFALAVAACLLGMGTKEVMVSAPLVVLLYDRAFLAGSLGEAWRRRRWVYAGLAATWLALAFLVLSTRGRAGTAGFGSGVAWWGYGLTQLPAALHYLRLCFWPHPLVFDYGSALVTGASLVAPGAAVIAGLLAATAWALKKHPGAGFLGASFFALLAPSSSIVPVATETMAEHRMYLPLIPVVVLVVTGAYRWLGRWSLPPFLLLAAALSWATWHRNEAYRSEEAIWADTVSSRPGNERARNNLGFVLSRAPGRMDEAAAQYREALRLKPDYAQAHYNLAGALVARPGRLDEAIAHYEEALRLEPGLTEAHYNLGCALEGIPGRLDEAIAHYEEALRQNPGYAEAHYNLGCVLQRRPGRSGEAIAHFREALRTKPDLAEAHNNLGRALEALPGRLDEAIAQYEEALRLKPGFAEAHHSLGGALQGSPGRLNDAIAQYEAALRLKPDLVQAHFNLAFALETIPGRLDEAVAQYEEALRLRPAFAEAHYNLGCVLQRQHGRLDEAVAHFQEALRLRPDYGEAHCNLGNALGSLGRAREAEAQYLAALRLMPDNATIHLDLGIALMKEPGREREAAAHLREAVRLEPGNVLARQMLSRIGRPGQ